MVGGEEIKIIRNYLNVVIIRVVYGFGYICGKGLEHVYILVHPDYQRKGIGHELVKKLLTEADQRGIEIVLYHLQKNMSSFI